MHAILTQIYLDFDLLQLSTIGKFFSDPSMVVQNLENMLSVSAVQCMLGGNYLIFLKKLLRHASPETLERLDKFLMDFWYQVEKTPSIFLDFDFGDLLLASFCVPQINLIESSEVFECGSKIYDSSFSPITNMCSSGIELDMFVFDFLQCLYLASKNYVFLANARISFESRYFFKINFLVAFGVLFLIISLFLKLGVAPFHAWVPSIYYKIPFPVMFLLATCIKVLFLLVLFYFFCNPFFYYFFFWRYFFFSCIVLSLVIGCVGTFLQKNIKKFFAYSSIVHSGFILLGLVCFNSLGVAAALLYIIIYILTLLGLFVILSFFNTQAAEKEQFNKNSRVVHLTDLKRIRRYYPVTGFFLCIIFLSLAGLPPFGGFFGKFYILYSFYCSYGAFFFVNGSVNFCVELFVFLISFCVSLLSSLYYLKLIKIMYFEKRHEFVLKKYFNLTMKMPLRSLILVFLILLLFGIFIVFFIFYLQIVLYVLNFIVYSFFFCRFFTVFNIEELYHYKTEILMDLVRCEILDIMLKRKIYSKYYASLADEILLTTGIEFDSFYYDTSPEQVAFRIKYPLLTSGLKLRSIEEISMMLGRGGYIRWEPGGVAYVLLEPEFYCGLNNEFVEELFGSFLDDYLKPLDAALSEMASLFKYIMDYGKNIISWVYNIVTCSFLFSDSQASVPVPVKLGDAVSDFATKRKAYFEFVSYPKFYTSVIRMTAHEVGYRRANAYAMEIINPDLFVGSQNRGKPGQEFLADLYAETSINWYKTFVKVFLDNYDVFLHDSGGRKTVYFSSLFSNRLLLYYETPQMYTSTSFGVFKLYNLFFGNFMDDTVWAPFFVRNTVLAESMFWCKIETQLNNYYLEKRTDAFCANMHMKLIRKPFRAYMPEGSKRFDIPEDLQFYLMHTYFNEYFYMFLVWESQSLKLSRDLRFLVLALNFLESKGSKGLGVFGPGGFKLVPIFKELGLPVTLEEAFFFYIASIKSDFSLVSFNNFRRLEFPYLLLNEFGIDFNLIPFDLNNINIYPYALQKRICAYRAFYNDTKFSGLYFLCYSAFFADYLFLNQAFSSFSVKKFINIVYDFSVMCCGQFSLKFVFFMFESFNSLGISSIPYVGEISAFLFYYLHHGFILVSYFFYMLFVQKFFIYNIVFFFNELIVACFYFIYNLIYILSLPGIYKLNMLHDLVFGFFLFPVAFLGILYESNLVYFDQYIFSMSMVEYFKLLNKYYLKVFLEVINLSHDLMNTWRHTVIIDPMVNSKSNTSSMVDKDVYIYYFYSRNFCLQLGIGRRLFNIMFPFLNDYILAEVFSFLGEVLQKKDVAGVRTFLISSFYKDTDVGVKNSNVLSSRYFLKFPKIKQYLNYYNYVLGDISGKGVSLQPGILQYLLTMRDCFLGGIDRNSSVTSFYKIGNFETFKVYFTHLGLVYGSYFNDPNAKASPVIWDTIQGVPFVRANNPVKARAAILYDAVVRRKLPFFEPEFIMRDVQSARRQVLLEHIRFLDNGGTGVFNPSVDVASEVLGFCLNRKKKESVYSVRPYDQSLYGYYLPKTLFGSADFGGRGVFEGEQTYGNYFENVYSLDDYTPSLYFDHRDDFVYYYDKNDRYSFGSDNITDRRVFGRFAGSAFDSKIFITADTLSFFGGDRSFSRKPAVPLLNYYRINRNNFLPSRWVSNSGMHAIYSVIFSYLNEYRTPLKTESLWGEAAMYRPFSLENQLPEIEYIYLNRINVDFFLDFFSSKLDIYTSYGDSTRQLLASLEPFELSSLRPNVLSFHNLFVYDYFVWYSFIIYFLSLDFIFLPNNIFYTMYFRGYDFYNIIFYIFGVCLDMFKVKFYTDEFFFGKSFKIIQFLSNWYHYKGYISGLKLFPVIVTTDTHNVKTNTYWQVFRPFFFFLECVDYYIETPYRAFYFLFINVAKYVKLITELEYDKMFFYDYVARAGHWAQFFFTDLGRNDGDSFAYGVLRLMSRTDAQRRVDNFRRITFFLKHLNGYNVIGYKQDACGKYYFASFPHGGYLTKTIRFLSLFSGTGFTFKPELIYVARKKYAFMEAYMSYFFCENFQEGVKNKKNLRVRKSLEEFFTYRYGVSYVEDFRAQSFLDSYRLIYQNKRFFNRLQGVSSFWKYLLDNSKYYLGSGKQGLQPLARYSLYRTQSVPGIHGINKELMLSSFRTFFYMVGDLYRPLLGSVYYTGVPPFEYLDKFSEYYFHSSFNTKINFWGLNTFISAMRYCYFVLLFSNHPYYTGNNIAAFPNIINDLKQIACKTQDEKLQYITYSFMQYITYKLPKFFLKFLQFNDIIDLSTFTGVTRESEVFFFFQSIENPFSSFLISDYAVSSFSRHIFNTPINLSAQLKTRAIYEDFIRRAINPELIEQDLKDSYLYSSEKWQSSRGYSRGGGKVFKGLPLPSYHPDGPGEFSFKAYKKGAKGLSNITTNIKEKNLDKFKPKKHLGSHVLTLDKIVASFDLVVVMSFILYLFVYPIIVYRIFYYIGFRLVLLICGHLFCQIILFFCVKVLGYVDVSSKIDLSMFFNWEIFVNIMYVPYDYYASFFERLLQRDLVTLINLGDVAVNRAVYDLFFLIVQDKPLTSYKGKILFYENAFKCILFKNYSKNLNLFYDKSIMFGEKAAVQDLVIRILSPKTEASPAEYFFSPELFLDDGKPAFDLLRDCFINELLRERSFRNVVLDNFVYDNPYSIYRKNSVLAQTSMYTDFLLKSPKRARQTALVEYLADPYFTLKSSIPFINNVLIRREIFIYSCLGIVGLLYFFGTVKCLLLMTIYYFRIDLYFINIYSKIIPFDDFRFFMLFCFRFLKNFMLTCFFFFLNFFFFFFSLLISFGEFICEKSESGTSLLGQDSEMMPPPGTKVPLSVPPFLVEHFKGTLGANTADSDWRIYQKQQVLKLCGSPKLLVRLTGFYFLDNFIFLKIDDIGVRDLPLDSAHFWKTHKFSMWVFRCFKLLLRHKQSVKFARRSYSRFFYKYLPVNVLEVVFPLHYFIKFLYKNLSNQFWLLWKECCKLLKQILRVLTKH